VTPSVSAPGHTNFSDATALCSCIHCIQYKLGGPWRWSVGLWVRRKSASLENVVRDLDWPLNRWPWKVLRIVTEKSHARSIVHFPHLGSDLWHHRPGPPPRYGHFGGRPSLIFSVSHLADGSLALSLLIDSKTVSKRRATLSVLFC